MSKFAPIAAFIFGAAAGSFVTWRLLKQKYQEQAEKEIASVKEAYSTHEDKDEEVNTYTPNPLVFVASTKTVTEQHYVPDIPEIQNSEAPYVISPDEYGELYDYNKVYLTYYADGAVADVENDILTNEEIEESIGYECLDHFGEYEDDTVYVRNDVRRCDYEITKDNRNYSELTPADI